MITQRKLFSHSDLISEVIIERLEPRLTARQRVTVAVPPCCKPITVTLQNKSFCVRLSSPSASPRAPFCLLSSSSSPPSTLFWYRVSRGLSLVPFKLSSPLSPHRPRPGCHHRTISAQFKTSLRKEMSMDYPFHQKSLPSRASRRKAG